MKRVLLLLLLLLIVNFTSHSYAGFFDLVNMLIDNNKTIKEADTSASKNALDILKDKAEFNKVKKLAESGDTDAQNKLGTMYELGEGIEKNIKEANNWYRKAAEQGNGRAQYNLGRSYLYGMGVLTDYKESVKWLTKSADQNQPWSQYRLGWIYAGGDGTIDTVNIGLDALGVGKDREYYSISTRHYKSKAKYWIKKAYENNDSEISKKAKATWDKHELWQY